MRALVSSPSGGEPGQPRKCSHFQRRLTKSPTGASNKQTRNQNRFAKLSKSCQKKLSRCNRRRLNRHKYREFKTWHKQYVAKPYAPARHLRQHRDQHAVKSAMLTREVRKSLFHQFKNPNQTDKRKRTFKLRYNHPLKVATLNVRGLIGEHAYVKKRILVDFMKKRIMTLCCYRKTTRT